MFFKYNTFANLPLNRNIIISIETQSPKMQQITYYYDCSPRFVFRSNVIFIHCIQRSNIVMRHALFTLLTTMNNHEISILISEIDFVAKWLWSMVSDLNKLLLICFEIVFLLKCATFTYIPHTTPPAQSIVIQIIIIVYAVKSIDNADHDV